jgi:hypothetical protein
MKDVLVAMKRFEPNSLYRDYLFYVREGLLTYSSGKRKCENVIMVIDLNDMLQKQHKPSSCVETSRL